MLHQGVVAAVLLGTFLSLSGRAEAEESGLPAPILDAPDLQVHRIETACNTYLLTCKRSKRFVVVDPGFGITDLVAAHARAGHTLQAIWVTHEHGDHVAGLGALAAKHAVPIVAHVEAKKGVAKVRANWKTWGMQARAPIPPAIPDTLVKDGSAVQVGELPWTVMHLPGHSPGSVAFLLPKRVLVAGDVLFKGSIGRTDLPTGDRTRFEKALSALWELPDPVVVLPGHGSTTTIGAEKKTNWLFQDFVRAGQGAEPMRRPWLGVEIAEGHTGKGLRLQAVVEDSPAARAGLRAGDVLLRADGRDVDSQRHLVEMIRRHAVGDTVPMVIRRGEVTMPIQFRFGARPPR